MAIDHEKSLPDDVAAKRADHAEMEHVDVEKRAVDDRAGAVTYTAEEERAVMHKLDRNLLPLIFVLYSLSVLDRSNLGNAKVVGMQDDIDLSGGRYAWLATIFYISYILSQFLTAGWKMFPPHRWIACVVFFWGIVSTMQATTSSWPGLMVCRFILGISEAMFGPGIGVYFAYFYPREKIGFRLGIFLSGSALANAYGGSLAYAIGHAHTSISNWRFLFIIEGVPTCLLAVVAWFFCPDSPSTARFFNEREKAVAQAIASRQPGDYKSEGLQLRQMFDALRDYKSYFTGFMYFSCNVSFASLPLFLPTIISEMGSFTSQQSNGLSAPPYLLCFIVIIIASFVSDRMRLRGPFVASFALIAGVGFIILATTSATGPRYFGIFLAVNIFVSIAVILPWVANNTATDSKRAGGFWVLNAIGQCGPLLGTNVFPSNEGPYYRKGMWICAAFCLLVTVLATTLSALLLKENRSRDRKARTHTETIDEHLDTAGLGDNDPGFRYIV